MDGRETDLDFPWCCAHCPHLKPVTGTCDHELRQSLVHELDAARSCSVYSEHKTAAMRDLDASL